MPPPTIAPSAGPRRHARRTDRPAGVDRPWRQAASAPTPALDPASAPGPTTVVATAASGRSAVVGSADAAVLENVAVLWEVTGDPAALTTDVTAEPWHTTAPAGDALWVLRE